MSEWYDEDELFTLLVTNEKNILNTPNRIITPDYSDIWIYNKPIDKTIVHVYNRNFGCGLGDFIRGSITLSQCAKHFNVKFHISFSSHPISTYLKDEGMEDEELSPENKEIHRCDTGYQYLYQLLSQFVVSEDKTIFIQSNLMYPVTFVTPEIKAYINKCFTFKDEYYNTVLSIISQFEQYSVIHIRCVDHYIFGEYKDDNLMEKIASLNLDKNTIVMANNYSLKKSISETFGFYFIDKEAGHSDFKNYCPELYLTIIE